MSLCHFELVNRSTVYDICHFELILSFRACREISLIIKTMSKVNADHNYYVYIITNKNKTVLYIGITNNLVDRLYYHNNPEAHSKHFSHKYRCKYLIYYEHFLEVETAISREKQLKKWNRAKKEFLINLKNPNWDFLNGTI